MTFIPSENKIYLLDPSSSYFYKIDCSVSVPVITRHASGVTNFSAGYDGAAYSPVSNRIYMAASNADDFVEYLDLETQTMGKVFFTGSSMSASLSCIYSPREGAIVTIPASADIFHTTLIEEVGTLDTRGPSCCVYNRA